MKRRWFVASVLPLLICPPLLAQRETSPTPSAAALQAASVRRALQEVLAPARITVPDQAKLPSDVRAEQLRLVWEPTRTTAGGQGAGGPRVVSRVRDRGAFPRLRALELAEDKLLVTALDGEGALRGWDLIPDPRFVRSEWPGPDGVLTGQIVPVSRPEFRVVIPDDPAVVEVRLFQAHRSSDGTFNLELVATFVMPPRGGGPL